MSFQEMSGDGDTHSFEMTSRVLHHYLLSWQLIIKMSRAK